MRCGRLSDIATPRVPDRQDSPGETPFAHPYNWTVEHADEIGARQREYDQRNAS
jgi:hypothetical protein